MHRAIRTLIFPVVLTVFAVAFAASAEARVDRPPLPTPLPEIIDAHCPGLTEAGGCYFSPGNGDASGRVYARGAVFSRGRDRFSTLHEMGHAFDATMMDAGERNRFAWLLSRDLEVWTYSYTDDDGRLIQAGNSLAEVFADAYANCRMGHERGSGEEWEAGYDYYPEASTHRQVCRLITRAGQDRGTLVRVDGSR